MAATMATMSGYDLLATSPAQLPAHPDLLEFRPLTAADERACCSVEHSAFPNPEHRATPEKFSYRISRLPNVSYGLFIKLGPDFEPSPVLPGLGEDRRRELTTVYEDGKRSLLIAHVVSTLGTGPTVTDRDMAYPQNWRDIQASRGSPLGHQAAGRTVCLHSLAVIPEAQRMGIGALIVRAYVRLMMDAAIYDRVALLCQSHFVGFYMMCGFEMLGASTSEFAGGGWLSLVLEFPEFPERENGRPERSGGGAPNGLPGTDGMSLPNGHAH